MSYESTRGSQGEAPPAGTPPRWSSAFAWVVAAGVFVMITAGGLVTTYEAGDSVPDWPLSFGQVFPERQFQGNVVYEHSHRMIGWTIGALAIALVAGLFYVRAARSIRILSVVALAALCMQGALGGFRVKVMDPEFRGALWEKVGWEIGPGEIRRVEQGSSIVHAVLAEGVFCLFVGLALLTGRHWREQGLEVAAASTARVRRLAILTVAFLAVQVVLGGFARQTGETRWTYAHLSWAAVVVAHVAVLSGRALSLDPRPTRLRTPAILLALLMGIQIALGFGAFLWVTHHPSWLGVLPLGAALLRTGHQAVGALVAAAAFALLLGAYRWLRPAPASSFPIPAEAAA